MGNACSDYYESLYCPGEKAMCLSHPDAVAYYQRITTFLDCSCLPGGFARARILGLRGEARQFYNIEHTKYLRSPAKSIVEASLRGTQVDVSCRYDPSCFGDYLFRVCEELNYGGWSEEVNDKIKQYGYEVRAEAWNEYVPGLEAGTNVHGLAIFVKKIPIAKQLL